MTRLLLVEDDIALVRTLAISLEARGFEVTAATHGNKAIALARANPPDVAIIDLGLPDTDGIDVVRALRTSSEMPILILSAREAQEEKVTALDVGADDYVTKPFDMNELLARLRAMLRRATPDPSPVIVQAGPLTIDIAARRIERAGQHVHLTPTEWNLLVTLMRSPGALVTHHDLLEAVWGAKYADQTNYLRVYMAQLRRKLEEHPSAPRHLLTEPGVGYRFEP